MSGIKFEIVEHIATITESQLDDGEHYTLELNKVSWNGHQPKYDIRTWWSNHQRMSKGITLTDAELKELKKILQEIV